MPDEAIISCRKGHQLRVPTAKGPLRAVCPLCHEIVDYTPPDQTNWRVLAPVIVILCILALLFLMTVFDSSDPPREEGQWRTSLPVPGAPPIIPPPPPAVAVNRVGPATPAQVAIPSPVTTKPTTQPADEWPGRHVALALPATYRAVEGRDGDPLPLLKVITAGTQEHHYVKLEDWSDGKQVVATLFIRAGETSTIELPPGKYRLKVASGREWYGTEPCPMCDPQRRRGGHLFGPSTSCQLAEDPLEMVLNRKGKVIEYSELTIELREREGGNLEMEPLSIESF